MFACACGLIVWISALKITHLINRVLFFDELCNCK